MSEKTTIINNVTVTEGELRAALKRLESCISNETHAGKFVRYYTDNRDYDGIVVTEPTAKSLCAGGGFSRGNEVIVVSKMGNWWRLESNKLKLVDNPFNS